MKYSKLQLWERFQKYHAEFTAIGIALDLSRMRFDDGFFAPMGARIHNPFEEMDALEAGAIKNPDEGRMVGHFWLRNPSLALTPQIQDEIETSLARVERFAYDVHTGLNHGRGGPCKNFLLIGIGGSPLGPQFVDHALGHPNRDKLTLYSLDNTDPSGIQWVVANLWGKLGILLRFANDYQSYNKETYQGQGLQAGYQFI